MFRTCIMCIIIICSIVDVLTISSYDRKIRSLDKKFKLLLEVEQTERYDAIESLREDRVNVVKILREEMAKIVETASEERLKMIEAGREEQMKGAETVRDERMKIIKIVREVMREAEMRGQKHRRDGDDLLKKELKKQGQRVAKLEKMMVAQRQDGRDGSVVSGVGGGMVDGAVGGGDRDGEVGVGDSDKAVGGAATGVQKAGGKLESLSQVVDNLRAGLIVEKRKSQLLEKTVNWLKTRLVSKTSETDNSETITGVMLTTVLPANDRGTENSNNETTHTELGNDPEVPDDGFSDSTNSSNGFFSEITPINMSSSEDITALKLQMNKLTTDVQNTRHMMSRCEANQRRVTDALSQRVDSTHNLVAIHGVNITRIDQKTTADIEELQIFAMKVDAKMNDVEKMAKTNEESAGNRISKCETNVVRLTKELAQMSNQTSMNGANVNQRVSREITGIKKRITTWDTALKIQVNNLTMNVQETRDMMSRCEANQTQVTDVLRQRVENMHNLVAIHGVNITRIDQKTTADLEQLQIYAVKVDAKVNDTEKMMKTNEERAGNRISKCETNIATLTRDVEQLSNQSMYWANMTDVNQRVSHEIDGIEQRITTWETNITKMEGILTRHLQSTKQCSHGETSPACPGYWGTEPCPSPVPGANTVIKYKNQLLDAPTELPPGAQLSFRCADVSNYVMTGSNIATCKHGLWTHEMPTCRHKLALEPCRSPVLEDNTIVEYKNQLLDAPTELPAGAQLLFSCADVSNYVMTGSNITRCKHGRWTHEMPTCRHKLALEPCQKPVPGAQTIVKYRNQSIDGISEFPAGAQLLARCTSMTRYAMTGSHVVSCKDGRWSSALPTCTRTVELRLHYYFIYQGKALGSTTCKSPFCAITDVGTLHVKKGTTITVNCHFKTNEPSLYKNGVKLQGDEITVYRYSIQYKIRNVTNANFSGRYTCKNDQEQITQVFEVVDKI